MTLAIATRNPLLFFRWSTAPVPAITRQRRNLLVEPFARDAEGAGGGGAAVAVRVECAPLDLVAEVLAEIHGDPIRLMEGEPLPSRA
jgi:hypothetical protein